MSLWKEYKGAVLAGLNVLLLLILIFGQNALSLFKTGYAGADPLVEADEEKIALIEITDPELRGLTIKLIRQKKLPRVDKAKPRASDAPKQLAYDWEFELLDESSKVVSRHRADRERVLDLLKGLENTRDYYGIPRNPKKEAELGMGTDEKGRFEGIELRLYEKPGALPKTLLVGKSGSRGSQTYVRRKEDETIYLAEENLRSLLGVAEKFYFRDRSVLPSEVQVENITMLDARWQKTRLHVQLSKQKENWILVLPEQLEAEKNEVESLLRDIAGWKASGFIKNKPSDTDPARSLSLDLYYNPAGTITDQLKVHLEILAKKDSSSAYYVQVGGESEWKEINSIYLEDLSEPTLRFRKRLRAQ